MSARYEIRSSGASDRSTEDAVGGLDVIAADAVVLICGEPDQSALHGVLQRIRIMRWELLDLRRTRGSPRRAG
ncbi:MAG TPA: hypothetical protein VGP36_12485 [Mycobacteriales bacterium]|nr:hypothetical protein [Mycobacteriales bacterium]